jgi:hypothetical protein
MDLEEFAIKLSGGISEIYRESKSVGGMLLRYQGNFECYMPEPVPNLANLSSELLDWLHVLVPGIKARTTMSL